VTGEAPPATLLVEDDKAFAESVRSALAARGYVTDLATTWNDGLAAFRIGGHELVIADYNLPGSSHGLRLLAAAKLLVPSSQLVLISGALSPAAEGIAQTTSLITFFRKTPTLVTDLLPLVEAAAVRASEQTNWHAFASGYVSDLEADFPEVREIDEALRRDIDPRG
jgi:ActR/RegA family two-component response regulator